MGPKPVARSALRPETDPLKLATQKKLRVGSKVAVVETAHDLELTGGSLDKI